MMKFSQKYTFEAFEEINGNHILNNIYSGIVFRLLVFVINCAPSFENLYVSKEIRV